MQRLNRRFLRRVISSLRCGACGRRFEPFNVDILGHRDELWFMSVFCSTCKSRGLVAAVFNERKAPRVATDLTEKEQKAFAGSLPVSMDDVLDIYNLLKDFRGGVAELMAVG